METLITEIKSKEQLKKWLKEVIKETRPYCIYFTMDDALTKNPKLRVLEDWEIHERMNYSFEYKDGLFEWRSGEIMYGIEEMTECLYAIILEEY